MLALAAALAILGSTPTTAAPMQMAQDLIRPLSDHPRSVQFYALRQDRESPDLVCGLVVLTPADAGADAVGVEHRRAFFADVSAKTTWIRPDISAHGPVPLKLAAGGPRQVIVVPGDTAANEARWRRCFRQKS